MTSIDVMRLAADIVAQVRRESVVMTSDQRIDYLNDIANEIDNLVLDAWDEAYEDEDCEVSRNLKG